MTKNYQTSAGIDIGKSFLDLYHQPLKKWERFANSPEGIDQIISFGAVLYNTFLHYLGQPQDNNVSFI